MSRVPSSRLNSATVDHFRRTRRALSRAAVRFRRDRRGNIAVIFALAALPLITAVGCAIDYSIIVRQRAKVQSALDSAILAGTVAGKAALDNGLSSAAAISAASAAASSFFSGTTSGLAATLNASFNVVGKTLTGTGSASASVQNSFLNVIGAPTSPFSVSSQSSTQAQPYMNVYLLVDVSASMLLPSTTDGITQMRAGQGCALACHDSASGNDSYNWALNNGIQLRYQVVNQGVQKLLDYLNSNPAYKTHVKVGLWSFDDYLHSNATMTSNFSQISSNFPGPTLAVNDEAAATPFSNYVNDFVAAVGAAGDGSSTGAPQKLVIIATDGVNDPTRAWTYNLALRPQVKVFDTSFCTTLKNSNVQVAIINTPYFPMMWDWGYQATLGQPGTQGGATRVDDIPIVLNTCVSKSSLFTVASDVQSIQNSFVRMFSQAAPIKLTN